jgi:type II secretory pathway component PulF
VPDDVGNEKQGPVVLTPLQTLTRAGLRLQHLMFGVVACALLIWLSIVAIAWLITLSFLGLVVVGVGIAVFFVRRNHSQQETLLWALAISAERSLPMASAALAFADQYGRTFRWRIQLLAGLMNQGASLVEALNQVPNLIRREALVLITTGAATGTLPRALREAAGLKTENKEWKNGMVVRFMYLILVLFVIQGCFGFLLNYIGPRYLSILNDFRVEIPGLSQTVMAIGQWLFEDHVVLMGLVGLVEVGIFLLLPLTLFNVFEWNLPLFDSLFRRRHTSLVLRGLALAVGGDRPIVEGLAVLAGSYPSKWVRDRLMWVESDVRAGRNWIESLTHHSLVRPTDAAVLASAERVGNLEWALRETAAASERRIGYRLQFWLQLLYPLLVMGIGALVFAVAVAFFMPLVTLIEALT